MIPYEFATLTLGKETDLEELNRLGREGFELRTIYDNVAYLQRPAIEQPSPQPEIDSITVQTLDGRVFEFPITQKEN